MSEVSFLEHLKSHIGETVKDPELPFLTIKDMGILRDITLAKDGTVLVLISPTFLGCPALDTIKAEIKIQMNDFLSRKNNHQDQVSKFEIKQIFTPPWSIEMLDKGVKEKLRENGYDW